VRGVVCRYHIHRAVEYSLNKRKPVRLRANGRVHFKASVLSDIHIVKGEVVRSRFASYINALALIEQSQTEAKEENATLQYISETFFQSVELVQTMLGRFNPEQFYKDYDEATDRDVAKRMFQIYRENNKRLPSIYEKIDAEFGGNSDAYVDWLYDNSQLTSLEKFNAIAALDAEAREAAFNNDPVYELAKSIFELYRELAWLFELKLGTNLDAASPVYRAKWRETVEDAARRGADAAGVRTSGGSEGCSLQSGRNDHCRRSRT
jgi:hypothetical protein